MKPASPELIAALGADLTTLCRLWVLNSPDGTILRFTDHHSDIVFEGNTYLSSEAFSASATALAVNDLNADVDIGVLLDETTFTYQKVERGLYDNAVVDLFAVSYRDLTAGSISLLSGAVNSVKLSDQFSANFTVGPILDKIAKSITETYTAYCRAGFGDARCKVNLAAHTETFAVSAVASNQVFTSPEVAARAQDYYAQGTVTWLTGANAGTRIEVVRNNAGQVFTLLPCKLPVSVGDTGEITRGCFKTLAACVGYGNKPNFRGEPYVPGNDGIV